MNFLYVYCLVSLFNPDRHYVGLTENLEERLKKHNSRSVSYTSKFIPWQIDSAHAFRSSEKRLQSRKTSSLTQVANLPEGISNYPKILPSKPQFLGSTSEKFKKIRSDRISTIRPRRSVSSLLSFSGASSGRRNA